MKEIFLFILICIHLLLLLCHLALLLKLVPYRMVWGGRIKSDKQMYRFETVSIIITILFTIVLLAKAGCLGIAVPQRPITISLWIMTVLYLVNTVGNLKSNNRIEQIIFAPLTIVLVISLLVILLGG
ncbi:MAG: hypothetical protein ABIQ88_01360 [Chitinophagaceae bacterium]